MSEAIGAGTSPAGADLERMKIEPIKELLQVMLEGAQRGPNGNFVGPDNQLYASGRVLLEQIKERVRQDLAKAAPEGEAR